MKRLPASVITMLSPHATQTCFFGDAYATEELIKGRAMAEGFVFKCLNRTSFALTELGLKIVGKDKSQSFTEFLDVLAGMRNSFSGQEDLKQFFRINGMDTRHDGVFEMYISGYAELLCDYVVRCNTETPNEEKVVSVYAYHKDPKAGQRKQ